MKAHQTLGCEHIVAGWSITTCGPAHVGHGDILSIDSLIGTSPVVVPLVSTPVALTIIYLLVHLACCKDKQNLRFLRTWQELFSDMFAYLENDDLDDLRGLALLHARDLVLCWQSAGEGKEEWDESSELHLELSMRPGNRHGE